MVIDNRPGANTNIGTVAVATSPPDGYTLLLTVNNLTINPGFYQNLAFDPLKVSVRGGHLDAPAVQGV